MTVFGQDHAAVAAAQYQAQPLGYQQITMNASALTLTVPTGARWAIITAEGTAADTVRWRDDGTAPTSTVGMPIAVPANGLSSTIIFATDLTALQFIGAATSKLDISYYK